MFSQDRKKQREFLAESWQKYTNNKPLEPLEEQLVSIIEIHPEYHDFIGNIESEYFPDQGEVNPFLHINLHLALREQISINQPKGVREVHQKLINHYKDSHEVEHLMMECIAEMIYISQKNNTTMDQVSYLKCITSLTTK
ncbi:DUF1841 family protein [Candidatus Thioglobus sp.]|nr:DUF1841 family protein [Candidatus Thioglobus sp.]